MKVSIDRVAFENNADIINYVTRGLSPSSKNFEQLILGLNNGSIKLADPNRNVINTTITTKDLELIYNNKKNNELKIFIIAVIGLILSFNAGCKLSKHNTDKDDLTITLF